LFENNTIQFMMQHDSERTVVENTELQARTALQTCRDNPQDIRGQQAGKRCPLITANKTPLHTVNVGGLNETPNAKSEISACSYCQL
jgi:hypothetical protein